MNVLKLLGHVLVRNLHVAISCQFLTRHCSFINIMDFTGTLKCLLFSGYFSLSFVASGVRCSQLFSYSSSST